MWACGGWRITSGVGGVLDELGWPSLEGCREQSSLTFVCRIRSGTVSLDWGVYLAPAPGLGGTGASHELQYTRYLAYSHVPAT